ncbi:MAG: sulfotransferase [Planctomycetales bacterium]|nr:sulfotransferase [Planctomycetales bacterium]
MHNSGTTVLAGCLHQAGLFLACNTSRNESHFFSIHVNDELIMGGGDNWAKLPILSVDEVLSHRERVGGYILRQWRDDYMQWGYDGCSRWGIKDARICVLLPLYLELFPGAKILFIRRDPDDIAASLSHREKKGVGIRNDEAHWRQLTEAHFARVREYGQARADFYEISYEELCRQPAQVAPGMFEFLEMEYTAAIESNFQKRLRTDRIGTKAWSAVKWRLGAIRKGLRVMFE